MGENHETSHLYVIKLGNNDIIKIGVIGLTFNMNKDKTILIHWVINTLGTILPFTPIHLD